MATHFTAAEFGPRRQAALAAMAGRGLDALLMFRQESMYYLTGFDTFGFCFFQCLVLTPEEDYIGSGEDALLCRYFAGRRHLAPRDQLTLEHAGV